MKLKYSLRLICGSVLAMAILLAGWEGTVHADNLTVNTLADENDHSCTDGDCSLRDAIEVAASGDTITFAVTGTITLALDQLTIEQDLTINGPGASELTISGNYLFCVFKIDPGVVAHVSGITLAHGKPQYIEGEETGGGGIRNEGTLTVNESTFWQNRPTELGSYRGFGGGIYNTGTLIVNDSNFLENVADDGGGIWNGGTAVVTNSTFQDNYSFRTGYSASSQGGAIDNHGTLTVIQSTFYKNIASATGKYLYTGGGGIANEGTLMVSSSTFSDNVAERGVVPVMGGDNLSGEATLRNTILVNTTGDRSCGGTISDEGGNLRWPPTDPSCVGAYGNPKLEPLADNGGPTLTMALGADSAALEQIAPANCSAADQRGEPRPNPSDTWCDTGAYESDLRLTKISWEDADRDVQYNGWRGLELENSLGTYRLSKTMGDTVKFKFNGSHIEWITRRGPQLGKAQVTIDGVDKGIVDLYSASEESGFEVNFPDLYPRRTTHRIVIHVTGEKNAGASDDYVAVDNFKKTDDVALNVRYNTWRGKANPAAGEGSYRLSAKRDAVARLHFDGTRIDWITARGPTYGKAAVWIDGIRQGRYDLYAPVQEWQVPIEFSGLSEGTHTVEIRVLGKKNSASSGKSVVLDGFSQPIK